MFRSSFAMMKASVFVILALSLTSSSLNAQTPNPGDDPDVQGAIRLFSAWLDGQLTWRELPGVAVGVVADQKLVWSQGFGYADIAAERPMTRDTRFRMASHSKLFTATAIMQLREQGKLRLDDPVSRYLPWFQVRSAQPDDPPITIEHLLTHSSGLPREAGDHWTTRDFPTQDELQNLIPERQAAFSPEVRWKYSNLASLAIAGMVVEAGERPGVGRLPADQYLRSARNDLVERRPFGRGVGHRLHEPAARRFERHDRLRRRARYGGGDRTHVDGRGHGEVRLGTRSARDSGAVIGFSAPRRFARCTESECWRTPGPEGRASGSRFGGVDDKLYVGHGGGYPGYTTNTTIQLDSKVGVVVLTNTNDSNPSQIGEQLMNTVGAAVAEATKVEVDKVAWDPSWARFAGLYRRPGRGSESQVVLLNERLVIMSPSSSNVDNPIRLEPLGNGVFRYTASTGGSIVGEDVRFLEENGAVVRMFVGDSFLDRVRD